jgi:hypothetical protein
MEKKIISICTKISQNLINSLEEDISKIQKDFSSDELASISLTSAVLLMCGLSRMWHVPLHNLLTQISNTYSCMDVDTYNYERKNSNE